jgi:predicted nucleotidyltransferase
VTAAHRTATNAWDVVQWPTNRARNFTRALADEEGAVVAVVAFGSAVSGCTRTESDVDILVVYRGQRPAVLPPPEVDVRWVDIAAFEAAIENGDDVVAWALGLGVALHDPEAFWSDAASRWKSRLPLPSLEVSAERSARARRYAEDLLAAGDDDAAAEQVLTMLTHLARATLAANGVFALSRPELPGQLRDQGEDAAATLLEGFMLGRIGPAEVLARTDRNARSLASRRA